jgi:DNA-binding MarR family transcriptional regulator
LTLSEVFEVDETTSTEKLVLLYLYERGCVEKHTVVRFEDIIQKCHISRSSVKRALKGLENAGFIDIFYQRGHNQSKHIKITIGTEEAC